MRVIPVIDLRGGWVVHAVGGQRETYRPVVSCLAENARPFSIARGMVAKLAAREVYVADLDALAGDEPDWHSLTEISRAGLNQWLDVGVTDACSARRLFERASWHQVSLAAVLVALERLVSPRQMPEIVEVLTPDRAIFSLDLREGRPMTASAAWQGMEAMEIARLAWEAGYRRLLVLDVAAVGSGSGPPVVDLCRQLAGALPRLELMAGGGIRGDEDLRLLEVAGCTAALVGTAVHEGWGQ